MLALFNQLPPPARNGLLQALLPLLTTAELLLLSSGISPRLKRDFLQDLPLELALHILSFVDEPRTLARASCVSRFWRHLLEDEWTWKEMCTRHRFAATSVGGGRGSSPAATSDDQRTITDDVTMFGSPRLGIEQAPGAPRMRQVGAITSPAAFGPLPPHVAQAGGGPAASSAFQSSSASSVTRFTDAEEGFVETTADDDVASSAVAAAAAAGPSIPASASGIVPVPPTADLTTAAGQNAFFASGLGSFPSLPDLFRAQVGGSGHSAAAVAVREALEVPSPHSFLAYALSSVQASVHAPAGMAGLASQFPFGTADEDDSAMSDSEQPSPALSQHGLHMQAHAQGGQAQPGPPHSGPTLPVSAAAAAAAAEAATASGSSSSAATHPPGPSLSPTRFFASLTNTLGLPYGTPNRAAPTQAGQAAAPPAALAEPPQTLPDDESSPTAASTSQQQQGRIFLPRGLGLAPFPARTASIGGRSTSSPLAGSSSFAEDGRQVGSIAAKSKGKGKAPRRRRSAGGRSSPEAEDEAEEEARFSYKRHFKRAYLTGASEFGSAVLLTLC